MKFKKLARTEVFRDPVYGYVYVDYQIIVDLINTKEMQRMKRIHQLGGTLQVFSTAEHSRFTHSLGTYEIARRILESSQEVRSSLSEEEVIITLCAALLHDIGHGPLSHAFEMIHPIKHEDYSCLIITGDTEVNRVLKMADKNLPAKIAQVINHTYPNPIPVQLISSQLDVDRLDFLLRDAYFTGTPYGHIDLDRLLRGITAIEGRLVFKENNVSNIENIILGRYHMYTQVYFHPEAYCYDVLVMSTLKRYFDLLKSGYQFKHPYTYLEPLASGEVLDLKTYITLDDGVIGYYMHTFSEEDDPILADLSERVLNRHNLKYKYIKTEKEVAAIKQSVIQKGYDPAYYFHYGELSQQVYKKYGRNDVNAILIKKKESGELVELNKISPIVKVIAAKDVTNANSKIVVYI